MAGSISLSLSQQFDSTGAPLNGGFLYFYAAGTTNPQSAYQDTALTLTWPNPIVLDAAGRVPPFYLADGQIKIRLTDSAGVVQVTADNLLVVGASSGSGSAPSVDATTILQTGDIKVRYGTGAHTGFVRSNGRTIGSATSGASERANADCEALFTHLWTEDANLTVSTGRGASAAADWAANKTIALPDWRGRVISALDDMGNTAAGRRTTTYTGVAATVLGSVSTHGESHTLTAAQIPSITSTVSVSSTETNIPIGMDGTAIIQINAGNAYGPYWTASPGAGEGIDANIASTGTATSNNTSGSAHSVVDPTLFATIYLKL